jgi:amino acid transporter
MDNTEGLKREIGLWGLVSNSINITIGAGIFILPAIVASRLGNDSIWPYLICGILIIVIMLCFAEIGTRITTTGGAYTYIESAFGSFAGFLTANIFIFGGAVMANAAVINGLADTISYFIPLFKTAWIRIIFFAVLFSSLAFINIKGVGKSIMLVKFTTIAKLAPLVIIGTAGWFFIDRQNIIISFTHSISDIGEMSLILLFAFVGAETALNVSGEIRNPGRTIPSGILISLAAILLIYLSVQLTVQGILGAEISSFGNAPLAEAASRIAGSAGSTLILIGAAFSMFGNLSGMVLNMPRILFAVSRDRVIPSSALARIHKLYKTPSNAIITYAVLGFIFASAGEFRQLAMLSSASYLLIYLGVVAAMLKFRLRTASVSEGFRLPGGMLIPIFAILSILWVISNLPTNELISMLVFIILVTFIFLFMKVILKVGTKNKPNSL